MSTVAKRILQALDAGETAAVVSLYGAPNADRLGSKVVVPDVGDVVGSFGDPAIDALAEKEARRVIDAGVGGNKTVTGPDGSYRFFIELIESPAWLIVVGAGHVAKPTAALGKMIGFRVTVLDDRPEFANWERFPDVDEIIADDFRSTLQGLSQRIHRQTYIVLVTRGHKQDEMALREVVNTKAAYVGMIGSRRRSRLVLEEMIKDAYSRELVARIHSPIGLDIKAETPEEIAVSIIGEIISVQRGGSARTLSARSVLRKPKEDSNGS